MIKKIKSYTEIEKLKGSFINEGREGLCYLVPGLNEVIKIYKSEEKLEKLEFMDTKSLYIAFPKDIYVDSNNNIIASTMPYLPGIQINDGFPSHIEILKIKEAYLKLLKELEKFPDIYMSDLCLDNILYDEKTNSFYIIDTKQWKNYPDSFGLNYARFDQNLSHALYKNISWLNDYDFWKDNVEFASNFRRSKNEEFIYFINYLDQTIELLSDYFNKEIITFKDLSLEIKKKS